MGVAVLGSVFPRQPAASARRPPFFVDGIRPALLVGTIVLGLGAVVALLIPRPPARSAPASAGQRAVAPAAA